MPPKPKASTTGPSSFSSLPLSKVHTKLSRSLALAIAPKTGIASLSLLQWCPEDLLCNIFTYANGKELANQSIVCREFYFATYLIGRRRFEDLFGGIPDPSLPRIKLFSVLQRSNEYTNEAIMRDLFMWSCIRGYTKMLNTILTSTNPQWHIVETRVPSTGVTPLILASEYNRSSVMKFLLHHTADPTKLSNNGLQPIHICARTGKLNLVHLLLKHNKELCNSVTNNNNYTPLMFATMGGHLAIVTLLLDYGAVTDTTTLIHDDQGNETAMHIAAYHGFTEIIAKLLSSGANPNIQMRNGRTPLLIACELGWIDIVQLLLTRSFIIPVDLSLTTDSGKTPLYVACEHGYEALVPILLEAGSNVTAATRRNKIPLYVAAEKGFITIARLLLQHADATGADVFAQTKYGTTPMYIASRTSNKAMKDLLLNHVHTSKKKPSTSTNNNNNSSASSSSTSSAVPYQSTDLRHGDTLFAEELPNQMRRSLGMSVPTPYGETGILPAVNNNSKNNTNHHRSSSSSSSSSSSHFTTINSNSHPDTNHGLLTITSGVSRSSSSNSGGIHPTATTTALNTSHVSLPTGNTTSEMKIRERARQAQEEAEEAIRQAEMQDKHRRQAVELAERAKRRLEEKAAADAALKAQNEAEILAKKEREELRRKEKEKQIALDFQARRGMVKNGNGNNNKANGGFPKSVSQAQAALKDIVRSEASLEEGFLPPSSSNTSTSILSQQKDDDPNFASPSSTVTFPLRPTSKNFLNRSTERIPNEEGGPHNHGSESV